MNKVEQSEVISNEVLLNQASIIKRLLLSRNNILERGETILNVPQKIMSPARYLRNHSWRHNWTVHIFLISFTVFRIPGPFPLTLYQLYYLPNARVQGTDVNKFLLLSFRCRCLKRKNFSLRYIFWMQVCFYHHKLI